MRKNTFGTLVSGISAGAVTGLLGAGGGMVLVPMLSMFSNLSDEEIFPASVAIILPVCVISLCFQSAQLPWMEALPYLLGSAGGGVLAGLLAKKIPTLWLHRLLGILILWGGVRYLC